MIMIALLAMAAYVSLILWKAVYYNSRSQYHHKYLNSSKSYIYDPTELRLWHDNMLKKYKFAASHPWLAVEPDPLPPDQPNR
jgi:hypothetical protein